MDEALGGVEAFMETGVVHAAVEKHQDPLYNWVVLQVLLVFHLSGNTATCHGSFLFKNTQVNSAIQIHNGDDYFMEVIIGEDV